MNQKNQSIFRWLFEEDHKKTEHASQKKVMNIQHRIRKEGRKTRRFNIKRKAAIRNWHSRARLIDIRKTKITLIGHEESHINHFYEREEEAVATPVTVVGGTAGISATLMQGLASSQQTGSKLKALRSKYLRCRLF